jgi:hypothetical protein
MPVETRTAAQVEAFAAHMDFLKALYRVECAAGIEGSRSVPDDLYSQDPFAELRVGTCELPQHRGLARHPASHR